MLLGIDTSTYLEQQRLTHQVYKKDGKVIDPFELFKENGVTLLRTRIWNDPYSKEKAPYLAGTCDVDNFINLAKKTAKYGFKHVVDFHYSDFWADPSKQYLPKAWENLSFEEMVEALYKFTKDSLLRIKKEGIDVEMVQVGNEITHGMLWPLGKLMGGEEKSPSFDRFAGFLKAGIKATKEVYPNAKIVIHFEESFNQVLYRELLSNLIKRGVHIDVVGMSYYPFWHHGFDEFFANVDMIHNEFNLEVMNVELGFPFTTLDYRIDQETGERKHLVINADNIQDYLKLMPFYPDKEGQAKFVETYLDLAKKHNLLGVCYWEPLWVPGEGICWASKEGQEYQHDTSKDTRNEWANQCLFDYEANALPAIDKFKL